MTQMEQMALDMVNEVLQTKEGVTAPRLAHIDELRRAFNLELTDALRNLCRSDILECHLDINKKPMFTTKKQPTT